jgi:hypothetical protein
MNGARAASMLGRRLLGRRLLEHTVRRPEGGRRRWLSSDAGQPLYWPDPWGRPASQVP